MPEHKYSAAQLREAANISVVAYDQWKARGFITSEQRTSGTGKPQLYSFREVFRAALLAELVGVGISIGQASQHVGIIHGFKNEAAFLLIRRFPELSADKFDLGATDSGTTSKIVRRSALLSAVEASTAVVSLSLDAVESRVKEHLGA